MQKQYPPTDLTAFFSKPHRFSAPLPADGHATPSLDCVIIMYGESSIGSDIMSEEPVSQESETRHTPPAGAHQATKNGEYASCILSVGGMDETRTRDLLRDRQAF